MSKVLIIIHFFLHENKTDFKNLTTPEKPFDRALIYLITISLYIKHISRQGRKCRLFTRFLPKIEKKIVLLHEDETDQNDLVTSRKPFCGALICPITPPLHILHILRYLKKNQFSPFLGTLVFLLISRKVHNLPK